MLESLSGLSPERNVLHVTVNIGEDVQPDNA